MDGSFFLGAYWRPRLETVEQCAERMLAFLLSIRDWNGGYTRWYRQGSRAPRNPEARRVQLTTTELVKALLRDAERDQHRQVIASAGYGIGLWSPRDSYVGQGPDGTVAVYAHVGSAVPPWNVVLINPFGSEDAVKSFFEVSALVSMMEAVVDAWEPDWCLVVSDVYLKRIYPHFGGKPNIGWLTYFAIPLAGLPPIPPVVSVSSLGSKGVLIQAVPATFSTIDPESIVQLDVLNRWLASVDYLGLSMNERT